MASLRAIPLRDSNYYPAVVATYAATSAAAWIDVAAGTIMNGITPFHSVKDATDMAAAREAQLCSPT